MRFLPHKTAYAFFLKASPSSPPPRLIWYVSLEIKIPPITSVSQYLLSSYYVPGLLPGTWNL